jgi:fatty-acyl-CoA synthase/long-chain acyl-CoA synthetase
MTASDLVARFARTSPDGVAFRDGDLALTWAQAPDVREVLTIGAGYEDLLASGSPEYVEFAVGDEDAAFIMYTSGTTGRPKGAVLTHRNLLLHSFSSVAHAGMGDDDRVGMSGAPLFHIAGVSGCYLNLVVGGTTVLSPSGGFDPAAMVDLLERERPRSGPRSSRCRASRTATSPRCAAPSGARRPPPPRCCAR